MQMLKRFSFSLLIVALILSCYAVPEVAAEGSEHVTMSKGDGYALYNGVKLPSLSGYNAEKYRYVCILAHKTNENLRVLWVATIPFVLDEFGDLVPVGYGVRQNANKDLLTLDNEPWSFTKEVEFGENQGYSQFTPIWSNYDIINTTDNSVHLAASDPIPLDGMNVIEWDGDTTGLETLPGASRYYHVVNITDLDVDKNCVFEYGPTGVDFTLLEMPVKAEELYKIGGQVRYVASASDAYPKTGLYFRNSHVGLFAYYPIEETTVDYTLTYSTEHGTAPETKTVTVNAGESYTLTDVDLPTLSADGYVFKGWTANGVPVFAGNIIDGDIHLVASWELEPVPDPPVDPDPPQPPSDEEPDGNGIEAVKALIDAVVGVMQIEFTLWGFTFTFWQMMLFGIFVYIVRWFIGGFFND